MMKRILLISFILFACLTSHLKAQDRTVTGKVTSADDGTALPGVNVLVKGTNSGTTTGPDGTYNISVPADATLIFSFIGLTTQEVPVGNRSVVDVRLASDVQALNEVVVTALGIEREQKSLGYAVQEIQGESLTRVKETNVINNLQGRIAGVQVQGNPGALGGSSRIIIRGTRSIAGENQPLFVVDGVPLDNSNFNTTDTQRGAGGYDYGNAAQDINPEDIESMSVLKGASAAALYGNRAANGVIIITTKKGRNRKGIGVNLSSDIQFQTPLVLPDYQNEYGGGAGPFAVNDQGQDVVSFRVDESWGPRLDGRPVRQWYSYYPEIPEYFGQATPWVANPNNIRDFYETGVQNTNSVSLSGGNEKATFRLSYTNLNSKGIMPNSNLYRNTISFNGASNLTDKLSAFIGVNYVNTTAEGRPQQGYGDVIVQFNHFGQRQLDMNQMDQYWITPTGEQRTWNRRSATDPRPQYADNPYWIRRKNFQNDARERLFGNVGLTYKFTDWLSVTGRVLNDYYVDRREERIANGSISQSLYEEVIREVRETNADLIFTANRNFGETFSVTALVGGNIRKNKYQLNAGETVGGLSVPNFFNLQNSAQRPLITDRTNVRNINSLFGSVNLGYLDMIFLEATLRNDWSSTLPAGNNSFLYPSVGASFVFTELGFLQNNVLSFGKLRASYAQVGNDTDPYRTTLTYEPQENFGSNPRYRIPLTLNNPNLRPEKTNSYEIGTDLRFFQNRLVLDASYYKSVSTDQIFQVPISGASGYTSQIINAGQVNNEGIEVALTGSPISTDAFRWDIGINWARNRNKLVELTEGIENYRIANGVFAATIDARVGQPLGVITGRDFVYDPQGNKVVDNAGVYRFSPQLLPLGTVLADWTGGISNTFSYKGINLSFLISAQQGGSLFSLTSLFGKYSGMMQETVEGNIRQLHMIADGVKQLADGSYAPNDIEIGPQDFFASMFGHGKAFVYDASFVKLREVSLGYSLPTRLTEKTPFTTASINLIGRNLLLLHRKVPHIDPEAATGGSGNIQGYEGGGLPSVRSYGLSVNLGF
jgi:TonB-linked SusC/RagA family outer membrane protein